MQLTATPALALALSTFLSLASGAPTAPDAPAPRAAIDPGVTFTPDSGVTFTPRSSTNPLLASRAINDCDDSTFVNQSSGGSPTVADCWQLYNNIAGDGTWTLWDTQHHTLATYGTCAFGARLQSIVPAKVGNGDIRDLVRDSIAQFSWNGLVGAKGVMKCQIVGVARNAPTEWGIFHT